MYCLVMLLKMENVASLCRAAGWHNAVSVKGLHGQISKAVRQLTHTWRGNAQTEKKINEDKKNPPKTHINRASGELLSLFQSLKRCLWFLFPVCRLIRKSGKRYIYVENVILEASLCESNLSIRSYLHKLIFNTSIWVFICLFEWNLVFVPLKICPWSLVLIHLKIYQTLLEPLLGLGGKSILSINSNLWFRKMF